MKRVLLTGASGFIGRQCIPLLLAKDCEVHALARTVPASTDAETLHANLHWHQGDLLAPENSSRLIQSIQPDSLLHLAWYVVPGKFWEAPVNWEWVRASEELFEAFAANDGKRLVSAGTCAEYASGAGECVEDSTPLAPATLYGQCKHELQRKLPGLIARTGVSTAWGRIFHLYGPGENPSRVVPYAIRSLLRGEAALCSDGLQVLDFLHVRDVASAFVALLDSSSQGTFNIASGKPVELRTVLQEIGRQTGRTELIRLGARISAASPDRWWGNNYRLTNQTGWQPAFDLQSGLADAIEWWRRAA
jgi:nucleoside-diphosphate-sugar epimerase